MLNWYRIERVLGRGGFGVIYLATDTNLDLLVAIKEYRPPLMGIDSDSHTHTREPSQNVVEGVQHFITEARNLVRFKHPNIVRVMSVFELNDTAYMVMEFEEGIDLREHWQRPENKTEHALKDLIVPITQGLAEVHRRGFVHRDIKPANILVRNNGSPVLLDFGSARSSGQAGTDGLTALVSAGYSPLEQYSCSSDRQQGPWTDIYALGAVLYFAISGSEPVDSAKRGSALLNGGKDPMLPALLLGQGRYTDDFLRAIDWALAFRIADRPQTLSDWKPALLRSPRLGAGTEGVTRKVTADENVLADRVGERDDSGQRFSMIDESVPREVRAIRDKRTQARRSARRHAGAVQADGYAPGGQAQASRRLRPIVWVVPLFLASALALSWLWLLFTNAAPDIQKTVAGTGVGSALTSEVVGTLRDSPPDSRALGDTDRGGTEEAVAPLDIVDSDSRAAQIQADQAAAAALADAEQIRLDEAAAAAAELSRLAALETDRRARLRARRQQLSRALEQADRQLGQGLLDEAEASMDEAASLDRNNAELKVLRTRWISALVDARTPVSDSEFDQVIERFDRLRRALENNDIAAMESLTESSDQNALFRQLMSNFANLDISIDRIRVTNADKSINARLRIDRMIRANGDRATPSPAYRDRIISSQRIEGKWSSIKW